MKKNYWKFLFVPIEITAKSAETSDLITAISATVVFVSTIKVHQKKNFHTTSGANKLEHLIRLIFCYRQNPQKITNTSTCERILLLSYGIKC